MFNHQPHSSIKDLNPTWYTANKIRSASSTIGTLRTFTRNSQTSTVRAKKNNTNSEISGFQDNSHDEKQYQNQRELFLQKLRTDSIKKTSFI